MNIQIQRGFPTMSLIVGLVFALFLLQFVLVRLERAPVWWLVFNLGAVFVLGHLFVFFAGKELFGISTGRLFKPDRPGFGGLYARIVLFPYRLGVWGMVVFFRLLGDAPISKITDSLYLSGRLFGKDREQFESEGIGAVIDVCAELAEAPWIRNNPNVYYLALPVPDNSGPDVEEMEQAVSFGLDAMGEGRKVLVHCAYGHGRSALVLGALLVASGQAESPEKAVELMQAKRDSVSLSSKQWLAFMQWYNWRTGLESKTVESQTGT